MTGPGGQVRAPTVGAAAPQCGPIADAAPRDHLLPYRVDKEARTGEQATDRLGSALCSTQDPVSQMVGGHLPATASTTMLLWDLDNVTPARRQFRATAEALSELISPSAPRIAAGHRTLFRACRGTLEELGFTALSGGRLRDGADRVLLRHARRAAAAGVREFFVVSNDHSFAELSRWGDLRVFTLDERQVSRRLADRARAIHRLGHGPPTATSVHEFAPAPTRQSVLQETGESDWGTLIGTAPG